MKYILIVLVTSLLAACAPVQQSSQLSQATNTRLVAGIGDTVISISKEKNLPNVFGASDIFGRKTPTGMTTIQYLGVHDGKAIFRRHSVAIETGATTMNSTPIIIPNTQTTTETGMVGGVMYSGTATTSGPPTVIPAHAPKAQVMDDGSVQITVDLKKQQPELIVEGKTITIESADDSKLVYSISQ